MTPVAVHRGEGPIILAQPHSGTFVPNEILETLTADAHALADTDWHIPELYDGLVPDATIVRANFNRYVIDANRSPDGGSLYPGQNTTSLVPLQDFDGKPIWQEHPANADVQRRIELFHAPYHDALASEIARVKARHGFAVLYDCHSIRSAIPWLFEGTLPDLNIGTNSGASCAPQLEQAVAAACLAAVGFSSVLNGRFKGGWTTRHYGNPAGGIHCVQMEIAQRAYLETEQAPFILSHEKTARLREALAQVFAGIRSISGELA